MARRLGDILIEEQLITPAQRDEALRLQKLHGGRIGTNLVELCALEMEALARALALQKGVPAALQKHFDSIQADAVALIPAYLAQKHGAVPLGLTARNPKTIAVAFLDPAKPGAIEEIQFAASSRIYPVVAPELQIVLYLERLYGIQRQPRFQRLDRPNPNAAGHWTPMSTPVEGTVAKDPHAFFDMSRPDLSQPRAGLAILLTEALPPEARATVPRSNSAPSGAQARAPAKPAVSKPAAAPSAIPVITASGSRATPPVAPRPAATVPPAEPPAKKVSPSLFGQRSAMPPPTLIPRATQPPPAAPGKTSSPPTAPANKSPPPAPSPPAPSSARRPAESVPTRAGRVDTSSRLPTIPEMPAFTANDVAPAPVTSSPPDPSRGTAGEPSSTSPTIKVDFSTTETLPPDTSLSGAPSAVASPSSVESQSASPAASASGASAPTPVQPQSPHAWTAVEAVDAMAVATNRDQIADAILNYLRSACGVGLVLIVQHEVAMGWKGFASGISAEVIDSLAIPLAAPSVLRVAHKQQTLFRGPPPSEGAALDGELWTRLGSPRPQEVIVVPILIRDRVVNLIYGHAADAGPLAERLSVGLGTLCRAAAGAYVRLIHDAKKKSPN